MNDPEFVVDASAALAALKNERFDQIEPERIVRALISAVNFSEVLTKLHDDGLTETQADAAVSRLDLRVIAFDEEHARTAAQLRTSTRHVGLSLGDRACLALAMTLGCAAVTADRIWAGLDIGVNVILIR